MSSTIAEKALARAAGLSSVESGQIIEVYPDLYMSHTATWRCIRTLEKLGVSSLYDPSRIAIVLDHISPARSAKTAADQSASRKFAREHNVAKFYDVNAGIAHVVLIEKGHVVPGQLIIGTDSHSTIYGALGALGTGVGFSEITAVWITGKLWMRVPETISIEITGRLQSGVYTKDLMLKLLGDLTADGATYKSIEFVGDGISYMSISERMTMSNLAMELGAKFAIVPPDDITISYLNGVGVDSSDYTVVRSDPGATYASTVRVDASELEPQVAAPDTSDNVHPLREFAGTRVDQVFIGSCANAKYDDLLEAASVLRGRKISPNVRLILTPASMKTLAQAADTGLLEVFLESGALLTNPGCGACAGDGGAMADGEVTFSTSNRNYKGRMGSYESDIFLGSPAAAAATAIAGVITDPREFLDGRPRLNANEHG